jgi:large subunit ribosomal protein L21
MYAVIETGGKQYRVEVGTELEVDLLEAEPGQEITLDRVLLVADGDESAIGRPVVTDAAVSAEVVRQARGEKVISFKYRPKARRRVKKGHRQELTILRITDVRFGKKSAADAKRKEEADAKSERQRLEEAAAKQAAADAELAAKLAKQSKAKAAEKPAGRAKASAGKATAATTATEEKAPAKRTTKAKAAGADAAEADAAKADDADAQAADAAKAAEANAEAAKADAAKTGDAEAATDKPAPKKTTRAKKDE